MSGSSGGFQADITSLRNFATDVSALATTVKGLANGAQLWPVDFGQVTSNDGFIESLNLDAKYHGVYQDLVGAGRSSLAEFASELNTLADVASWIANQYESAQNEDTVGYKDIDSQLGSIQTNTQWT